MKKTTLRHLSVLLLATALLSLAACSGDSDNHETSAIDTGDTVAATETVRETDMGSVIESVPATAPESSPATAPESTEVTVPETVPTTAPASTAESDPMTDPATVPETEPVTEPETRRDLTWETYDPALDNSTVDIDEWHPVDQSQWVMTDGLGRVLSTNTQTGDKKDDKIVAIFYWTWHGDFAKEGQSAFNNRQNIEALIAMGKTERDYVTLSISELNKLGIPTSSGYHFWDEPVYGYYSANDRWVIRKQAELLAAADVDVVFFDNTNGTFTWMESAKNVMEVFSEARMEGVDAPAVSFMLPFAASGDTLKQLQKLYKEIYKPGFCSDVWFELDGKPMLMAHKAALNLTDDAVNSEIRDFFTFRANVAGYTDQSTAANQWGWLSRFPQAYYKNDAGVLEQMTVGVAINHDYVNSVIAPMSLGKNIIGRTWTSHGYDTRADALLYGACFEEQWENALAVDPRIVFVTAWNEWVAMRISEWRAGPTYYNCFVDQYNPEYSRDCEPSTGVLKDHYYYQLAEYIRQFKGTNPIEAASPEKLMDVSGGYGQWENVGPVYNDYFGLPDRDALGYKNPSTGERYHYTNDTGRNDIYDAKVARDYESIYFMVRTVENLTDYTDAYWMNLYIDMGETDTHWENYEFVLNKTAPTDTTATLERFTGDGYNTEVVCQVTYSVKGNMLTVCIPKTALGIPADVDDFTFGFKWTDNTLMDDGDIMKWYVNGDVAPVGRFNYCYTTTGSASYVPEIDNHACFNLTDADTRTLFAECMKAEGMDFTLSSAGLTITSTAGGSDAFLRVDGDWFSPAILTNRYDQLAITYRVVNGTTDALRVGAAAGSTETVPAAASRTLKLTADGESYTGLLDLTKLRVTGGYLHEIAFFFAKDAEAGQSVIIEKIEFVKAEE